MSQLSILKAAAGNVRLNRGVQTSTVCSHSPRVSQFHSDDSVTAVTSYEGSLEGPSKTVINQRNFTESLYSSAFIDVCAFFFL